jgi:hypothetical protein
MTRPKPPIEIGFTKPSYTIAEWAQACSMSEQFIRDEVKADRLVARYPHSSAVIFLEDGLAWFRRMPTQKPARRAS